MLNSRVLVLNRLWQAVNVCSAKRALSLLYQGRVQAINEQRGVFTAFGFENWKDFSQREDFEEEDGFVKTVSFRIKIPQIVLLLFYDRLPRKEIRFSRKNIYERDRNTCQYCGKRLTPQESNLDHIVPRTRGGKHTWENVVTSCLACNLRKGHSALEKVKMNLIHEPRRPGWRPFMKLVDLEYESWKHFLDTSYWKVEIGEE